MKLHHFLLQRPLAGICALLAASIVSLTDLHAETIPLPEHPRPDFRRADWANLAWYRRVIEIPAAWNGRQAFLIIGASDRETQVWLDGKPLGTHRGDYTPFEFNLTDHVKAGGKHHVVLRVDDARRSFTLHGKQGYGNVWGYAGSTGGVEEQVGVQGRAGSSSESPNSYPMSDHVRDPSLLRVVINGCPLGLFDLDDDPADCTVCGYHNLQNGNRKFGQPNPSYVSLACCAASGQENLGKYGESIYFHKGAERLFVNLFIASELNWKSTGISLRQQTEFPAAETSTITLSAAKPAETTISFRKPYWAESGFSVSVNGGTPISRTGLEGYVDIHRTWNPDDVIRIHLPMTFRWEGFRDNPRRAAILRGPLVMVAKTTDGLRLAAVHGSPEAALDSIKPGPNGPWGSSPNSAS